MNHGSCPQMEPSVARMKLATLGADGRAGLPLDHHMRPELGRTQALCWLLPDIKVFRALAGLGLWSVSPRPASHVPPLSPPGTRWEHLPGHMDLGLRRASETARAPSPCARRDPEVLLSAPALPQGPQGEGDAARRGADRPLGSRVSWVGGNCSGLAAHPWTEGLEPDTQSSGPHFPLQKQGSASLSTRSPATLSLCCGGLGSRECVTASAS